MLLTLIGWMIGIALYLVVGGAVAEWTRNHRPLFFPDWLKAVLWLPYLVLRYPLTWLVNGVMWLLYHIGEGALSVIEGGRWLARRR